MLERGITKHERKTFAESIHRRFVDIMHPIFGINPSPDYVQINFRLMIMNGSAIIAYPELKILLCDAYLDPGSTSSTSNHGGEFEYTTAHESAHILHAIKNGENIKGKRSINTGSGHINEIVADLASLIFFDIEGDSQSYLKCSMNAAAEIFTAHKETLFRRPRQLLTRIVTQDPRTAYNTIREYLGRNYVNSEPEKEQRPVEELSELSPN